MNPPLRVSIAPDPIAEERAFRRRVLFVALFLTAIGAGCLACLTGCASAPDYQAERVRNLRARLPTLSRVGVTDSMRPHLRPGQLCAILPVTWEDMRARKASGKRVAVCFWPDGYPFPVVHELIYWENSEVGRTRGTKDLRMDWQFHLTRENYIGVVPVFP